MVNFFDSLYSSTLSNEKESDILKKFKLYSIIRLIIRSVANFIIPLYYIFTSNASTHKLQERTGSINISNKKIITLTTFPARIGKVWIVIETILRQKIKPDKIILWLSKDQFNEFDTLPNRLKKQTKRGLEIRFVEGDIRSHKKYYYAIKEYPEDLIITIDDDIFYRDDFIQTILNHHNEKPLSIISCYCRKIKRKKGELCPYNNWPKATEEKSSSSELFFGSGGGTLFPSHSLYEDVLNIDLFSKLTPLADDVWLNTMSRLRKTYIHSIYNRNWLPLPVIIKKDIRLAKQNVSENLNDQQIENVRNYYINKMNIDPFEQRK